MMGIADNDDSRSLIRKIDADPARPNAALMKL